MLRSSLVPRPDEKPHRCSYCQHTVDEFGPYLKLVSLDVPSEDLVVMFVCAACIPTLLSPLEVVPRTKLLEAHAQLQAAEERLNAYGAQNNRVVELEQTVSRLEDELERARGQIVSLGHTIKFVQGENVRKRKEALLAEVAGEKPQPKSKTAKERTAA